MPRQMMGTVDKALSLMRFFSPQDPELGLSELARRARFDKATTLRCMTALERNGFVEQDAKSRRYRVGLTPLHLAQIRERSFPIQSIVLSHLETLAARIGETAHGTLLAGPDPVTVAVGYPNRALFVHVDPSSALPWHATASGIAIAANLSESKQRALLDSIDFVPFTQSTFTTPKDILSAWATCRAEGIAHARSTFEDDVLGSAAAIFGQAGEAIGAVAIAAVSMRMTPALQSKVDAELKRISLLITNELGGAVPIATSLRSAV